MSIDLLSSLNKNGSGLNIKQLAQTLALAETAPKLTALQSRVENDTLRLSALSQIRSQFAKLDTVLREAAANPVLTVSTSSAALMPRVTDRALLIPGAVPLDVQALATRQVLEISGLPPGAATVQAGSLTVDFGTWSGDTPQSFAPGTNRPPVTITIPEGTTLDGLTALLSDIDGVTARVLNKGDGTFSLGIVGETGVQNALRLTAAPSQTATQGSGDIALALLDTTTTNDQRQVQAAADARVLVDGIAISRPDNVLTDVLPGMQVTLSAIMSGTLEVGRDRDVAADNIQNLIAGLNETLSLMRSLTQRGFGEGVSGDLAGDRTVEAMEQALRRLIATPITGYGPRPINLADMGIATQRDGLLRFDPPAFDRTFALRPMDVDALFTDVLRPLTDGLKVAGRVAPTLPAGDYIFATDRLGHATLDGARLLTLDIGDGRKGHVVQTGALQGLTLTSEAGITSGAIRYGRSFAQSLSQILSDVGTGTGMLSRREAEIDGNAQTTTQQITTLEARAAVLEKRYLTKFAAMEQAVTQMKSTGSYIQNLVDLWGRDR